MFDPQKSWPFGLSSGNFPRFAVLCLLIMGVLSFTDAPVTLFVMDVPDGIISIFQVITRLGSSDWILIPSLVIGIIAFLLANLRVARRDRLRRVAVISSFIFVGVAAPGIIALIIKRMVGRARPVIFDQFGPWHFQPNLGDWTMQSFPSGDTTTIFALAVVLIFLMPRFGKWFIAVAALVGLSRIMVGVHYPTDVFGGFLTGSFGAYAVRNFYLSRNWLFQRNENDAPELKPLPVPD